MKPKYSYVSHALVWVLVIALFPMHVRAAERFELPPINYATAPTDNPVSRLQESIESGAATLEYDKQFGYLKSVLDALAVPLESQLLVFSKTSLQSQYISPERPRAIYFNDDVYVGTVQHGDVLEVSVADPNIGAAFYTVSQRESDNPGFERRHHSCLQCHGSTMTRRTPGHLVRSVYPDNRGFPILKAGTHITTNESPFDERWGGWYVTGTHGRIRHMGNVIAREIEWGATVDMDEGANREQLDARVNAKAYLTGDSDIVAHLVLAHQVQVHNRLTEANFETRYALEDQAVLDEFMDRDPGALSVATKRRIANVGEKLLDALLFKNAVTFRDSIRGSSDFVDVFQEAGPKDSHGRSLREFDLRRRLFKYPVSYLIYTQSFGELPEEMKAYVYRRLWKILSDDEAAELPHVTPSKRIATREILLETLPDPPEYWTRDD